MPFVVDLHHTTCVGVHPSSMVIIVTKRWYHDQEKMNAKYSRKRENIKASNERLRR